MNDTDRLAALLKSAGIAEWDCDPIAARLIAAGVTLAATPAPLDETVRGALARAWKRRAKMYKSLYLRHLNEMGQWRSALRLAGIGQMGDLNPDAIRLTITVPSEKRINEMVEERIAAIRDATPAPLDVPHRYGDHGWCVEQHTPAPLDRNCPICHNVIVKDAHGGPHPSPGDHDTGPHVAAAYAKDK